MNSEWCKIYCCSHIFPIKVIDPRVYVPLHTGQAYDNCSYQGILGDDCGNDNISTKKEKYDGLLTGLYWIWKNDTTAVKGLCTYRGYLSIDRINPFIYEDACELFQKEKNDFVTAQIRYDETVIEEFKRNHDSFYYNHLHDPMRYLREVIASISPDYVRSFDESINGYVLNYRHTFLARREYFDAYCEWLFCILFEYEKYLNKKHYSIPPRFFGYMAERLERVWLLEQSIRIVELPIVFVANRNNER